MKKLSTTVSTADDLSMRIIFLRAPKLSISRLATSPVPQNILSIPDEKRKVYLGETLAFCVVISNDSNASVIFDSLKVEMQSQSQRYLLEDFKTSQILEFEDCIEKRFEYSLKDLGVHTIISSAVYTSNNETKSFKKFFKFNVQKPFEFKQRCVFLNKLGQMAVEAQLQNLITDGETVYLNKVSFEPSASYKLVEMSAEQEPPEFDVSKMLMRENDIKIFLFKVSPCWNEATFSHSLKEPGTIGRVVIQWTTGMGERGLLNTSYIFRSALDCDIGVAVLNPPETCSCFSPCEIHLYIANTGINKLNLSVTFDNEHSESFFWAGVSGVEAGILLPHCTLTLTVELVPLKSGLQTLSGLRLRDSITGRTFIFDDITKLTVCD